MRLVDADRLTDELLCGCYEWVQDAVGVIKQQATVDVVPESYYIDRIKEERAKVYELEALVATIKGTMKNINKQLTIEKEKNKTQADTIAMLMAFKKQSP